MLESPTTCHRVEIIAKPLICKCKWTALDTFPLRLRQVLPKSSLRQNPSPPSTGLKRPKPLSPPPPATFPVTSNNPSKPLPKPRPNTMSTYQPPTQTNGTSNAAASGSASVGEGRSVDYTCGDCDASVSLKRGEPIRCRSCGHRVLYKQRTNRYVLVSFENRGAGAK
jgi:DNA-directed RNA polymerase I, II, and III subunit RPABC4